MCPAARVIGEERWIVIEQPSDNIILVGTAHISQASVDEVEEAIRTHRPTRVLVELDPRRYDALKDPEAWQNTDVIQVLRQKKQHLFLLQLYLASMQAKMGRETGVAPGSEMLAAVQAADEVGAEVVLMDRDIGITLKRGFGSMGFWQRLRLFWRVWMEVLTPADKDQEPLDVDALLQTDAITQMTEEFARFAPVVKTALIDERDAYMAGHIHETGSAGHKLVAVLGAGHMPGILRHLKAENDIPDREGLDELPPPRLTVGKVLAFVIPVAILGAFGYLAYQGFQTGNWNDLREAGLAWILINGTLSALGAALALGHPLSILVAFVAAPITSLNPLLAAGWFAGLTEAKMRTPKVSDFQAIKHIETLGQFWRNGVVRVILVTALANLGSSVATWIAAGKIIDVLGGG